MNPSPDTPEPVWQSLTDDAAHLPSLAAREARRTRAAQRQRRRLATAALALIAVGLGAWRAVGPMLHHDQPPVALQPSPTGDIASSTAIPEPTEYIKVQTVQEALSEPLPMPAGLSKEQQDVVTAARGLPLLLVKDASGKVTRIHAIEQ